MVFYPIAVVGVIGFLCLFFIYAIYSINRSKAKEFIEPQKPIASEVVKPPKSEFTNILEIEGIGPIYAEKLKKIGIKTTISLLEAGSTSQKRKEIAEKTGISQKLIIEWVKIADLMRIKGVGEEYSDLLEEAGVNNVIDLSKRNPRKLHAKLLQVNKEKKLVRRAPTLNAVQGWVMHANADNLLNNQILDYDQSLKGGTYAVKADNTSRSRNRESGGEIDSVIGISPSQLTIIRRQQRVFKESIQKASEPHNQSYEENQELVEEIEKTAYDLGANLVGFTEVTPDNIYAGKEVPYRYVVVVAMRMDKGKIETAPSVDFMIEAANIHVLLGDLVNKLCDMIKELGFDAVPSPALGGAVDYPSLARMAGMGEYGRHGLLISKFNGSCQRLAVVFTNLKLPIEKSNPHRWVQDFCSSCGKCIKACPSNAILEKPEPTKAGHYSCIEEGKCLLYLTTHFLCSICIKECPFTTIRYDRIKEAFERSTI
jgi:predicted flap endonuclease-1-like 5' DNA nuclease/ferredoxin